MSSDLVPKLITGPERSCSNWQVEGALRMLVNNVVQGAVPAELIVYGGGKAARNWECFAAIERSLRSLQPTETLLIQSGKPVGVLRTHEHAPRVLIANSLMVPRWANDEMFESLERQGLTMYGQMTAGSWSFIGQQGIMQGTYETFVAAGAGPGKFVFTAGLGNMGGAQAPAGRMTGATTLVVEIDPAKIERCQDEGWIDESFTDVGAALDRVRTACDAATGFAIAVQANVLDVFDRLLADGLTPNIVTDQTGAHDPLRGYFPQELSFDDALRMRTADADGYIAASKRSMRRHVEMMLELQSRGATAFDYGNGIRFHAWDQGLKTAFDIKGFVPLYVRPLFCQGRGPFRVAALSGDVDDIAVVDAILLELFADNPFLCNWIRKAQACIDFARQPGLPARVCWLGMGERATAVERIWRAVRDGRISAPIWVGRDHLDCGSVASPGRETEDMLDGSDCIADWPILNALVATASGASWVSVHDGGGVGHGKAIHAGQCLVITPDLDSLERAIRVLTNDPAMGVLRHADAGYPEAIRTASSNRLMIPMQTWGTVVTRGSAVRPLVQRHHELR